MRSLRNNALFLAMLPLLAAGVSSCSHKQPPPPPPAATAPPLPPTSMTKVPLVPTLPAPAQPQVEPPGSDRPVQEAQPTPPPHPKRAKKHPLPSDASAPTAPTTSPAPTVAAAAQPEPSLGQLSAGPGADSRERAAISVQIHEQELRLSKVKYRLNEEDQAIAKQVEAFLTKARQAMADNDLDGAQTLTTKAKVLLDELTRS